MPLLFSGFVYVPTYRFHSGGGGFLGCSFGWPLAGRPSANRVIAVAKIALIVGLHYTPFRAPPRRRIGSTLPITTPYDPAPTVTTTATTTNASQTYLVWLKIS